MTPMRSSRSSRPSDRATADLPLYLLSVWLLAGCRVRPPLCLVYSRSALSGRHPYALCLSVLIEHKIHTYPISAEGAVWWTEWVWCEGRQMGWVGRCFWPRPPFSALPCPACLSVCRETRYLQVGWMDGWPLLLSCV